MPCGWQPSLRPSDALWHLWLTRPSAACPLGCGSSAGEAFCCPPAATLGQAAPAAVSGASRAAAALPLCFLTRRLASPQAGAAQHGPASREPGAGAAQLHTPLLPAPASPRLRGVGRGCFSSWCLLCLPERFAPWGKRDSSAPSPAWVLFLSSAFAVGSAPFRCFPAPSRGCLAQAGKALPRVQLLTTPAGLSLQVQVCSVLSFPSAPLAFLVQGFHVRLRLGEVLPAAEGKRLCSC